MAKKKAAGSEVSLGAGLAPARAVSQRPKRAVAAKHSKAKSAPAVKVKKAPVASMSEQDEVALVAYLYFEKRGFQGGSQEEDWLRAEQEVRLRRAGLR